MRLSTLYMTCAVNLVAERFVKSNSNVELVLKLIHVNGTILEERGVVCKLGESDQAKNLKYFNEIEDNIHEISERLIAKMEGEPLFEGLFLNENTVTTFILGGIFDSF